MCHSTIVFAEKQLNTVKVEGGTKDELSPYDLIGNHQSIDSENFNQNFTTLSDILSKQSGIEIQSIGGVGQYSSPSIRGSSGQQVLVFWDGLLINGLSGGSADLGNLNLSHAGKIDIYRSTAPVELSSSAIGGVIHIQSPMLNTEQALNGELSIVNGSYGTQQYSFMQHLETRDIQWLIAGEYLTADNDFDYLESNPTNNTNQPAYEARYNNGSEQYQWLLKGFKPLDNGRLDLAIQSNNSDREISSKINTSSNESKISTNNNNIQLRLKHIWNKQNHSEMKVSISKQTQLYDDRFSSIGLGAQLNEYITNANNLQFNHYLKLNNIKAAFILRSQNEDTKVDYRLLNEEELNKQCLAGQGCETAYKRNQHDIASRLQYIKNRSAISFQVSKIFLVDNNLTSNNSKNDYSETTWSSGYSYHSPSGFEYYLTLANQVRLPTTNELFGDRGLSKGNTDLVPETAIHRELGIRYQGSTFNIHSSIYFRDVKQAISAESDSTGVIRYSNLGKTHHIGIEQTIDWRPIQSLSISANLTLQSNEIVEDKRFSFYEGKQVAGYSQLYTHISTRYEHKECDITISNAIEAAGYYTNSNSLDKDNKNKWDLTLGKDFNNTRISLDISDLTNNSPRDYPDYPNPGRMYFFRINTKW